MYTSETASGRIRPKDIEVPRNKFNKSKARFFELPMALMAPFHVERLLPNDTIDTSYDINIELRNPLKKPIVNNIRFYVKSYVCRDIDLWEGALRYHDKGIRQDQALEMPKLNPIILTTADDSVNADPWENFKTSKTWNHVYTTAVPLSPWDYMGLPWIFYNKKLGTNQGDRYSKYSGSTFQKIKRFGSYMKDSIIENFYYEGEGNTPLEVNALPFVMYVKIKRKDFLDSNLTMKNTAWFPDQDDHFRLPYNCNMNNYGKNTQHNTRNYVNVLNYDNPLLMYDNISEHTTNYLGPYVIVSNKNPTDYKSIGECSPKLNISFYAPWRLDYFTGASPFSNLIRNGSTIPSINIKSSIDASDVGKDYAVGSQGNISVDSNDKLYVSVNSSSITPPSGASWNMKNILEKLNVDSSSVNIMQMRDALAKTLICERIGLIENHDFYNGYMKTIYGTNIHGECHDPIYIGGGYFDWNNSIIENQSAPNGDGDTPLGYVGANGNASGHINSGMYTTQDFGWFMSILYCIPDTIYNGGIEKEWNKLTQSTDYNPLLQGTTPSVIEKREIGLPSTAEGWNSIKNAWGYTKRDEEYKTSTNKITGFGACRTENFILDQSYFIKREFTTETAVLNEENIECTPDNCKCYSWASQEEPEFRVMAQCNCYITREMMKSAEPSNLGMFN